MTTTQLLANIFLALVLIQQYRAVRAMMPQLIEDGALWRRCLEEGKTIRQLRYDDSMEKWEQEHAAHVAWRRAWREATGKWPAWR